jgi:tetratricopeptide (TPR) repeat protein
MPNVEAEAYLRSLLNHESPLVRVRATSGLAMIDSDDALMQKLGDESRSVRLAASRSLASRNQDVTDPRAAKEWADYLGFNSDRPQSLLMLANKAARESRPEEVADRVGRAIALDARNPDMYHQCAILLSSAGLYKEARKALFNGWELAPEDSRFPYSLGLLAAETGDLQSAVSYLEETVAMAPDFYRAWYNLSLAYQKLNRPEDAQRAMQKAQGR